MSKKSRRKSKQPATTQQAECPAADYTPPVNAGLMRRLAAMLYDGLLLIAVNAVIVGGILVPLGTPASSASQHQVTVLSEGYRNGVLMPAILLVTGLFYAFFWKRGGQTLGMQTWHLQLHRADGHPLSWRNTFVRYLWGLFSFFAFGAGYWWMWFDREGLTLHDRLSGTRVYIVKPKKKEKSRWLGMFSRNDD